MLEGKRINLRLAEKEDVLLLAQWLSDVNFAGEYQHFPDQISRGQLEKRIVEQELHQTEWVDFIIEKKDGRKIGWAVHYICAPNFGWTEIGFAIIQAKETRGTQVKQFKYYLTICFSQGT